MCDYTCKCARTHTHTNGLEFPVYTRLALNTLRSSCICPESWDLRHAPPCQNYLSVEHQRVPDVNWSLEINAGTKATALFAIMKMYSGGENPLWFLCRLKDNIDIH